MPATEKIETLDYYVGKGLDFFEAAGDYALALPPCKRPLVIGSQSGYWAGVQMFRSARRAFASAKEVNAQYVIDTEAASLDGVVLVSATGSRQMVPLADYALKRDLPVYLIVCKANSQVTKEFKSNAKYTEILVGGMDRAPAEPPTINTNTYGRMLQGVTHEDPRVIRRLLTAMPKPVGGYTRASALTIIVSDRMEAVGEMVGWKINGEKIGRQAGGIAKYLTNLMHGAFVVDAPGELYVALGLNAKEQAALAKVLEAVPSERKLTVDLPEGQNGPLAVMLAGYSIVGRFQEKFPAFQNNIPHYAQRSAKWEWISPLQ
jgi:hypothetical protein